ncbi:MAG: hypothetical protein FD173_1226 [Gallionellaceae bacterium]|nr:MAG: hypothetical protein FD173_1226 [Gallionellaceae bacterium]
MIVLFPLCQIVKILCNLFFAYPEYAGARAKCRETITQVNGLSALFLV